MVHQVGSIFSLRHSLASGIFKLGCGFGLSLLVILLFSTWLSGQAAENPFELKPRLAATAKEQPVADKPLEKDSSGGNPFEIKKPQREMGPVALPLEIEKITRSPLRLSIVIIISLILVLVSTFLRPLIAKTWQAFRNDNLLNQLLREQEGRGMAPSYILYALFFLNGGIFLYLSATIFNIELLGVNPFRTLVNCIGLILALMLFKHLVIRFIGYIFPIDKEIQRYNFLIIVFGSIIGLILAPVNLLLAYGPEELLKPTVGIGIGALLFIYLFRTIRALLIGNRFIAFHKFHFLLYICTIEIAPVLVFSKLILSQL